MSRAGHVWVCLLLSLLLGMALGCGEGGSGSAAPPDPHAAPAARAPTPPGPTPVDAANTFRVRCATCHGEAGDGHGPASAGLDPQPRDLRDPAWQDSVSDAHIESIIAGGGPAVGLSAIMPPHPDLAARPGELAALRAYVRSLRR